MNNIIKGGKVVASGGFGCIFNPALKCKNEKYSSKENNNGRITKLMTNKHAVEEFKRIEHFKNILNVIPNYENYFLLDNFTLCRPDKLTKNDLTRFNRKCKALTKKGIKTKNINNSLNQLLALNMPDGGVDIEKYINPSSQIDKDNLIKLNVSLIDLLVNGIVKMNNLHVYHCDIKDSNVLVKENNNLLMTRLIDWGLSVFIPNDNSNNSNKIPKKLYRRPFQYNVPFSIVLFNTEFVKRYNSFLNLNPKPDYFLIREFVINYIFIWNDIRGPGHLSAINNMIKKLTLNELPAIKKNKIKDHIIEYDFTYYYITEYISQVLFHFTKDGQLHLFEYFNTIFLKNIDIWGFVMIYISMFELLYEQFDKLNEYQIQFINKIKYIIIHFLYESPTKVIVIEDLVKELTSLNNLAKQFDSPISPEYVKSLSEMGGKKYTSDKSKINNKRKTYKKSNKKKVNTRKIIKF